MVATGRGAEHGVLIRSAAALERMTDVTTIVIRQDRHSHRRPPGGDGRDRRASPHVTGGRCPRAGRRGRAGLRAPDRRGHRRRAKELGLALRRWSRVRDVSGQGVDALAPDGRALLGNRV
jgi:hypothetical protein